ncbi:MAG: glycosyltransferase family 2 protein [Planctomycetota bacterium]
MQATLEAEEQETTGTGPAPRLLVVIPAKDEAHNLPRVLDELLPLVPAGHVLVVDDGSSDRTGALARAHGCRVVRHPFNLGYGASLLTGYHLMLREGFDLLVQLDADGQHPPAELPRLLAPLLAGEADHVLGSRYLDGGHAGASLPRRLASSGLTTVARWMTGRRFSDPTSGFQAMRREVVEALCHESFPEDFPDLDVLMDLDRRGFRLVEIATPMRDRLEGTSMHGGLRILYYFYRLFLSIALMPVRRPSLYRKDRGDGPRPPAGLGRAPVRERRQAG